MTTASRSGSSCSSCQTGTASASRAPSAHSASRSSCEPGYVITPILGCGLANDLHLVRLDQRVREQPFAHLLHLRLGRRRVRRLDLEVDHLADPRVPHLEAEVAERRADRLPLRIEDARLRPHEHGGPHPSTTVGSSRYAGNGIVVSRSKASWYLARVTWTTSSGSSGPGSVLSQPVVSQ